MKRAQFIFLAVCTLLLFFSFQNQLLFSQVITGDILGTVKDTSGAVVPNAKVRLMEAKTGITFTATTDSTGGYLFAQLKPGTYNITVSKTGFRSTTISDIDLLLGQRPRVNIVLHVGEVSQHVTVSAGGVQLLETQTSSTGQVLQSKAIEQLPLSSRNFMDLTVLTPAVSPILGGNSPATTWTGMGSGNASVSVAGLRESNVSYMLDGIETRNARFGSADLHPSVDALQEFKMQTDGFSAQYGRSSAIVNMTLKSGTNKFHGDAYEFIRNSALDANNYFSNSQNLPRPPYQQNDFGATLGGPIIHNKIFFFVSYEAFRSRLGETGQALVPSSAQWQGDLADNSAGTGIFPTSSSFCQSNPSSAHCLNVINPFTGQAFPGNVIPQSMLNSRAQEWHAYTPTPNVPSAVNSSTIPLFNYAASPKVTNNFNDGNIRIDESLSSKDDIYGSYSYHGVPHTVPSVMPLQGVSYPMVSQVASISENHIFSPTIVNTFRFGYNRGKTFLVSQGALGPNYAAQFGYTNTSTNPFDFGIPDAGISGFNSIGSFAESIGSIDQDYEWYDNLSIVHGNQNMTMGGNVIHEPFYQITDFSGIPNFGFTGQFTGSGLADMLLGIPFTASTSVGNSAQYLDSTYFAGYFEDDWRARPDLTLNLGLRYSFHSTPSDANNRTAWFNPAIGQVQYSNQGQVRNGIVNPDYDNWAPRIGFAYSPSFLKNTVIRAAGGVFYATDNWNELQFLVIAPKFYSTQSLTSSPTTPTLSLDNLFPPAGTAPASTFPFSLAKNNQTPYVMEWNLDVQHMFGHNWLADVGYVGNRGDRLPQRMDLNHASFDPSGTIPIAQRRPYPQFSGILWSSNRGWSDYNALTMKVEKRFSSGLYLLGAYTYSKCLDIGNTDDFSMTSFDFNVYDKGNCDYNSTNRAVFSYAYSLPVGHGKHFLSGISGVANTILGGWQVSGITTFQSGQFMSVSLPVDWMNVGNFTTSVPDKVGPAYPAHRTVSNWLNINSFTFPGCPSYVPCSQGIHIEGNSGRNQILEPGINNWDIGLLKNTKITERFSTQFRAEFFNAWNHTQFGPPDGSLIPGQFGRISSLLISPREIQFALKIFW